MSQELVNQLRRTAGDFGPPGSGATADLFREAADAIEVYEAKLGQAMSDYEEANGKLKVAVDALEVIGFDYDEHFLRTKAREALASIKDEKAHQSSDQ